MAVQLAAAAGGMAALTKAFGAADQYTNMQNRLLALGASHESAAAQIRQLGDIALATRAPLESTVELYSRLSLTSESLGASQAELMEFTETVGLALAASGTTAAQASGALTQLSQAMAGGVVRAEEFNSMIEGAPGLLMAVANGIEGVNGDLGALRQMMLDGELTSESFFNALLSQNEALQESFGNTAPTIASAFTAINNEFTLFIGSADQATGVTSAIAEAMLLLAENMDVAVPVFGAVAVGVAAISAPILAAGVAIGALAVAVITHWDEIKEAFKAGVDYVMGLGPRLVQALKDAGRAALDAAKQIGADIVAGIRIGITQKWEDLKSYVNGLGTGLISGIKGVFESRSPSRVMMRLGNDVVEGLIIGIDDNTARAVAQAEEMGRAIGQGVKDGLDPVLRTVFDGLARGDLGSIGSGLLGMAQQGFSSLLQTSFAKGGGGFSNLWKGITGSFTGIGDAYRGAGGGIGGIGAAISSMLPGIGAISSIVGVVQSVIGTTTKLTNALEGTLGIGGLLRGTEYDIKQKDNIFGSKTEKNAEEIFGSWAKYIAQDLDTEFRDMVQNTRDSIRALGLDINEAFTYNFDVQFDESLPHEQLMERLRQELDRANDELLRTSLAAAGLARDGETGAQTLLILNDSLRTANASLRLLDQVLFDVSAIGAGAARELVEVAGGMDAFASKTAYVFDNFLTEGERDARALAIATENLSATFGDLQRAIPATHDEFIALLDAQDLTTAAGRNTYAALLDVAQAFVTVNGAAQSAAVSVQTWTLGNRTAVSEMASITGDALRDAENALRAAFAAEQDRVSAAYADQIAAAEAMAGAAREQAEAAAQSAQERVQLRESIADALERAFSTRRVLDALGARSLVSSGTAFLRAAVAAGGTSDLIGLQQALDAVADPATALFGSFAEYQQDFNVNTNLIEQLKDLNAGQLSVEMRALRAAESTVDAVSRGAGAQVSAITAARDAQLAAMSAQMNALLGIDTSVMTVAQAIANLQGAQAALVTDGATSQFAAGSRLFNAQNVAGSLEYEINQRYRSILGRNVDAAGLDFYGGLIASGGFSLSDLQMDLMRNKASDVGIPAFANGGAHSGGWRMVGERGPELEATGPSRIYSNSQSRSLMDTSRMEDHLAELNDRIRRMQIEINRQGAIFRDWNTNGQPGTREGAVMATQEVV